MMKKLSKNWTDYLVNAPETGMGYQKVTVTFTDGTKLSDVIVKNAEDIFIPQSHENKTIQEISI